MDNKAINLLNKAHMVKAAFQMGSATYDDARAAYLAYTKVANTEGERIAKKHGMKYRPISITALMR